VDSFFPGHGVYSMYIGPDKGTIMSKISLTTYWHNIVERCTFMHTACIGLSMRTRRPRFEFRVAPLFHWVATLGKLFTHDAYPVSQLQETGVQKGVFGA